jgi:sigma-B regulation protein RsbU (phosphoserine phosphatase)
MEDLERKLRIQELEINSLFEVSKAINENKSFEEIFRLYEYALKAQLKVKKLALFIEENKEWKCKVNFGTTVNFEGRQIHEKALEIKEECQIMKNVISPEYNEFQLVAPIKYKKRIIAYLLLGGMYDKGKIAIEMDIPFTRTFTNLIVVALENRRLAEEAIQQEAVKKELDIAKRVQTHLFPDILPDNSVISVAARNLPHQSVGGDYYDFISVENGFFICVADVSGKGVPAALLMSNFQAAFRTLVRQTQNLKRIVEELNRLLYENAKGELFVTAFLFKYDTDKKRIEYVNAGHNPGILLNNSMVEELATGTTVLGAFNTLPFMNSEEISAPKFKMILFSDGVSEAENQDGKQFGEDGIIAVLNKNRDKPVSQICDAIMKQLDGFRGDKNYNDDLTLIVCEKL